MLDEEVPLSALPAAMFGTGNWSECEQYEQKHDTVKDVDGFTAYFSEVICLRNQIPAGGLDLPNFFSFVQVQMRDSLAKEGRKKETPKHQPLVRCRQVLFWVFAIAGALKRYIPANLRLWFFRLHLYSLLDDSSCDGSL